MCYWNTITDIYIFTLLEVRFCEINIPSKSHSMKSEISHKNCPTKIMLYEAHQSSLFHPTKPFNLDRRIKVWLQEGWRVKMLPSDKYWRTLSAFVSYNMTQYRMLGHNEVLSVTFTEMDQGSPLQRLCIKYQLMGELKVLEHRGANATIYPPPHLVMTPGLK